VSETCPFEFNFDPATFKVGDTVSYRVPSLGDFPFVGTVTAVYAEHIEIVDGSDPGRPMRASRVSRPVVSDEDALA
jgi:hypothetical protein